MSNLTSTFNTSLEPHKTHCVRRPRTRASTQDEFLKEAYKIAAHTASLQSYLRSVRQAYLSTTTTTTISSSSSSPTSRTHPKSNRAHNHTHHHKLTPHDLTAIDASTKSLLRSLSASLRQLHDAESLRRTTAAAILAKRFPPPPLASSFLARWAAGDPSSSLGQNQSRRQEGKSKEQLAAEGEEETIAAVRESVLWWLGRRVEKAAGVHGEMVERRLRREGGVGWGEKAAGFLVEGQEGGSGVGERRREGKENGDVALREEENGEGRRGGENELSAEQLQLFEGENRDLLRGLEDTLDQVRSAESSLLEIATLQQSLAAHLDIQSASISQLVADSLHTTENVGKGNKELKKANERKSTARIVFWASCGLCAVLVGWDLVF